MASDADLCNLALGHVGDDTIVTSIDPPDSSAAAGHCARFYAPARRMMLEMGTWSFALKRGALTLVDNDSDAWGFKYALPSTIVKPVKILGGGPYVSGLSYSVLNEQGSALFEREGGFLRCNEPQAVLLYVDDVSDPTLFTPTFAIGFSYLLASFIVGPIVKGSAGISLAQSLRQLATATAGSAMAADANASVQNDTSDFVSSQQAARGYGTGDYNTVRY